MGCVAASVILMPLPGEAEVVEKRTVRAPPWALPMASQGGCRVPEPVVRRGVAVEPPSKKDSTVLSSAPYAETRAEGKAPAGAVTVTVHEAGAG